MFSSATRATLRLSVLCAIILIFVVPGRAQAQGPEAGAVRTAVTGAGDSEIGELKLVVGRSALVNVGQPITRVSLTKPEVADAVVTGAQQILVHGKMAGTISMFVWDRAGGTKRYDVVVSRDLAELRDQLSQLFPGEPIIAASNGRSVVISGAVSNKYVIEKAAEVAAAYVEKKEDVVNLLRQKEGIATNQVLLRVRFAEVNRSAMTELGLNMFSDGNNNTIGSATTQQFSAPFFDQRQPMVGKNLVFSDYLNLFLFNSSHQLGITVRAMQNRGLLQSLAEPNLIAENGKEASFLAGGEYPYPVAQGVGGNLTVTIVFKEYGIRLTFTPTLMGGDLVHLKVRPEVSSLDFANSVTYQGFKIPALATRRAETEIELQDGQTFAIAGLMNNSVASSLQKVPGIGDIPILGYLFRSKSAQKQQTELVVMITPQILRRGTMGAAQGLPNLVEPFMGPNKKPLQPPAPKLPGAPQQDSDAPAAVPAPAASSASGQAASAAAGRTPNTVSAPPMTSAPTTPVANSAVPANATQIPPREVISMAPPTASAAQPSAPADPVAAAPVDPKKAAAEKKAAEKQAAQQVEADRKAQERAQKELKKQQEAEKKAAAERAALEEKQKKEEAKKAEAQRKAEEKQAAEQRKIDARQAQEQLKLEQQRLEAAKKQSASASKPPEVQIKPSEAEKKQVKELQEAQDRLKAAQAAYDAAVEKAKKSGVQ
ncbi:MAG: pilus assembly protein N-terminal domain-containing protein [Bacteroidales bacterium]